MYIHDANTTQPQKCIYFAAAVAAMPQAKPYTHSAESQAKLDIDGSL